MDKGLGLTRIEAEVLKVGGKGIKKAERLGQIFCELEPAAVEKLKVIPGLLVKQVSGVHTADQVVLAPGSPEVTPSVYASSQAALASMFYDLRASYSPPLLGTGYTVCVLDTGIRKSHVSLRGKVVDEINLTTSPSADDVFNHGTGVAYAICGGRHAVGEEAGLAPGAKVINIKIIGDDGKGSTEDVIEGIDEVLRIYEEATAKGLETTDDMFPNAVNMSFGTPDDGDPDNPLRLALKTLREQTLGGIVSIEAAAGNSGPSSGTIDLPAASEHCWAAGAVTLSPFDVWESSSRGPTPLGLVKPDLVFYGVNILLASAESDTSFTVKTGTSFAAPFIVGGKGLIMEFFWRYFPAVTEWDMVQIPSEVWREAIASVSVKGAGAPAEKDDSWGYGMPMGDRMLRLLQQTQVSSMDIVSTMMGLVVPVAMVGMMAGALRS